MQDETPPTLLLFHGLLSSPQEFGLIAHNLRMRGIVHHALSLPGYTFGTDAVAPDWRRWRDAAVAAVEAQVGRHQPVVLGGLCTGSMLAVATALEMRRRVAGLVLMSPPFKCDGWGLTPIRHLRHLGYLTRLDRFFSVAEREPYGVKNERIRQWVMRELQERNSAVIGPARVPLRGLRESERMAAAMRAHLAELDCPLLAIHAREDEITRLDTVRRYYDALPQPDKELAVLDNSYHMITIDNDRHEVAALLERFVKRLAVRDAPSSIRLQPAAQPRPRVDATPQPTTS